MQTKLEFVYICGGVTGLDPDQTFRKFMAAQLWLESCGYCAINPLTLIDDPDMYWRMAMKICIDKMIECDRILFLPEWELSRGAKLESKLADELEIPRMYIDAETLKKYGDKVLRNEQISTQKHAE